MRLTAWRLASSARTTWLNKDAASRTHLYGTGITALIKQGWNEIPEVMGSAVYGVIGIIGIAHFTYNYYKNEVYNHRYKTVPIIYRPEDERVKRVRKFEDSPQPTRTPPGLASCA